MKIGNNGHNVEMNYDNVHKLQDPQIKTLQTQIENVKKRMQSLAENEKLDPKEKIEKQKALQDEFDAINQKIIARQNEIIKEKMQTAESQKSDGNKNDKTQNQKAASNGKLNTQNQANDALELNQYKSLQNLVAADTSFSQTKQLSAIKKEMIGQAKILRNQIATDRSRGISSELKASQLSKLEDKIDKTASRIAQGHEAVNELVEKSRTTAPKMNRESDDGRGEIRDGVINANEVKAPAIKDGILNDDVLYNSEKDEEKTEVKA